MPVPDELLAILVCPVCRHGLRPEGEELVCTGCGLRYPVRDGIPVMLAEEARRPGDAR
jgi:uncharacterized protein YbaR (Trm112 family)